jgi:hypothetical protein
MLYCHCFLRQQVLDKKQRFNLRKTINLSEFRTTKYSIQFANMHVHWINTGNKHELTCFIFWWFFVSFIYILKIQVKNCSVLYCTMHPSISLSIEKLGPQCDGGTFRKYTVKDQYCFLCVTAHRKGGVSVTVRVCLTGEGGTLVLCPLENMIVTFEKNLRFWNC